MEQELVFESYNKENSVSLSIRFTKADYSAIKKIAEENKVRHSDVIRRFVKNGINRVQKTKV